MLIDNNPFAMLTAVATPAILTNACSVLTLGTASRIARVVDRSRVVMKLQREDTDTNSAHREFYSRQLDLLRTRSNLLLNALRFFYTALAMFMGTALIAIIGSIFVALGMTPMFHGAAVTGLVVGSLGVLGIVLGCGLMVRETYLAISALNEEHDKMSQF